ncbi:helix-turn-helix domain-containing protein [Actinacidiphila epipremni]|jgi:transcriptional regulator with XRE-family HTH domain|uniref:Helix-turn-helix domain-containing protein n=1 Tax=Actinacidiphila epipremni TaxID=2053013 RepID=A0ABX0ZKH3_9ACTN|nr:helix-turn-helix transcriptional regulator [Actinacidiphila epipremni]NJP42714.1 helix-turn-helix domain-containing protein [Actinacidiphila epipremni]
MNIKELDPKRSLRAAYGASVRSSREERSWTQHDLAVRMGYGDAHISAVETGTKPPTLRFSRSADIAFGTGDKYERMYREMRNGVLLEGFPEYVEFEGRASEIRLFEVGIIPGLMQTPEYARVLAYSAVRRGEISPEHAEERVTVLMDRQARLTRRRPPMVFVVMDESCIRRTVGGREVMASQLDALVEFAERATTVLQVIPFESGERRSFDLPVNVLTLPDRSLFSYAESQYQGRLEREETAVARTLMTYHQLQAEALSQADTVALIAELRKGIT